jgi:hypothetical protein
VRPRLRASSDTLSQEPAANVCGKESDGRREEACVSNCRQYARAPSV